MSELRLDGKVAIVTGSGRGLGRAYADLLAARGARVIVNDPGVDLDGSGGNHGPAQDVVDAIRAGGGTAEANFESVASEAGAEAMVAQAIAVYGRIDIVVNNAGHFLKKHPFAESSADTFSSIWQVHVMGTVNVIRAAWPHLVKQRSGRIINTGSHVAYLGNDGLIEYSAAKGAIHGLTRTLSLEAAEYGIAVNGVAPAGMTRPNLADSRISERFATDPSFSVDLVAPTVLWLAHEDCDVNGETFGVMAGTTSRIAIVETSGFASQTPTPEAIRDNFDAIMARDALASSGLDMAPDGESRGQVLVARYNTL